MWACVFVTDLQAVCIRWTVVWFGLVFSEGGGRGVTAHERKTSRDQGQRKMGVFCVCTVKNRCFGCLYPLCTLLHITLFKICIKYMDHKNNCVHYEHYMLKITNNYGRHSV